MEVPIGNEPEKTETRNIPHDIFLDMLPHYLSDQHPRQEPPRTDELDVPTRRRYLDLMLQRRQLAEEGRFATGGEVVIFVSDVGSEEYETHVEGVKDPMVSSEYLVSAEELQEHMNASENIKHRVKQITGGTTTVSVQHATMESIVDAVKDEKVAHIIFIGHANSSQLAIEPYKDFGWDDPKEPLDHLKLSFGVFGCGGQFSSPPKPPVGLGLVAPEGILYGIGDDYMHEGTPYDFNELIRLSTKDLEGTNLTLAS